MTPHLFDPSLLVIFAISCTLAYLAGSISAAILVCRFAGLPDPRTAGSNNPGATNVLRVGGKGPAALTLLGDALKGYLPVLLAGLLAGALAGPAEGARIAAIVALAAFLGHLYPVFFDFRGGKGVATAFGALLALNATAGLLAVLAWLAMSLAFRRSSLAALVTFTLAPALLLIEDERAGAIVFVIVAALLFWTHRANIRRLLDGTEPTIGKRGAAKTGKASAGKAKVGNSRAGHAKIADAKATDVKGGAAGGSKTVGTSTGGPPGEADPVRADVAGADEAGVAGATPPRQPPAAKRPKPAAKRKAKKKARKKSKGR